MRIGVDCRSLQELYPTGVSIYTDALLQAMCALPDAAEHAFVFFMNGYALRSAPERLRAIQERYTAPNIQWRIQSLPNKVFPFLEYTFSYPSVEWMFENVDVIFVPNLQFFPLRTLQTPMVLTIHDLSFERFPDCLSLKGRIRHRMLQPKRFATQAQHIITVSEHTAQEVHALYGISTERISTVYPGIDHIHSTAPTAPVPQLPERYILSVATVEPRKNIGTLLVAFQQLLKQHSDIHLVIAGAPGWKSRTVLEQMKQIPHVLYLGYTTEEQKRALYQHATAFVYPSVYEGFGFPPLEAQCFGVPTIVGSHSSLPEVLGDSALFVDVLDVYSLVRAMHHILTDDLLRQRLIERGTQNVQRFRWKQTAQRTLNILTSSL